MKKVLPCHLVESCEVFVMTPPDVDLTIFPAGRVVDPELCYMAHRDRDVIVWNRLDHGMLEDDEEGILAFLAKGQHHGIDHLRGECGHPGATRWAGA